MAQVINTNIASLNAQRNLTSSQTTLATSLQRLSSGLRINSAKDDAAGLAISERFSTQIRGLNQAVRNANDGVSMAQTGEGALAEIGNNLQRIRELAVQAANVTNSASDRAALDLEVQQRLAEIDRTASQTSFNGQKILNGGIGNATFQVGSNVGETISVGFSTSTRITDMGARALASSGVRVDSLITAASAAVAGSYDVGSIAAGYDFTNITAAAATVTTGVIAANNYSSIAATHGTVTSGSVTPTNYSSIAATKATLHTESIAPHDYSSIAATKGTSLQAGALVGTDSTAGGAAITFTVGGDSVTVADADYTGGGGLAALVTAVQTGLDAAAAGKYAASNVGGKLQIQRVLAATAGPDITVASAGAIAAGITAGDVVTPGAVQDNSANKTFTLAGPGGSGAVTVNLTTNITTVDQMVTAITSSTGYGTSGVVATNDGSGHVLLTASVAGAGSIVVGGTGSTILENGVVAANVAGVAQNNAANKTFTLVGSAGVAMTVNLTSNITNAADLVAAIVGSSGYGASGMTASDDTLGHVLLTNTAAGVGNVTVGGANANILTASEVRVGGAAQDNSANRTFTLGGPGGTTMTVTLNSNITTAANMVSAITGSTGYAGSGVVATDAGGGKVLLTASNAGAGDVTISGTTPAILTAGQSVVHGIAANNQNAGFTIDTHVITLTTDADDQDGLISLLQGKLDVAAAGVYQVSAGSGTGFKITTIAAGAANPAAVGTFTGAGNADFGSGTAVAGAAGHAGASLDLAAGDLSIALGGGDAVAVTGLFTTAAQLVNAINSNVQGVYASVNSGNGKLELSSSQDITLAGLNSAATELAFGATSFAADGDLSTGNTLNVANAESLIQRVDSALETVSTLRSTFGAVQNRFESTMANLMGTSENLTAARSRIVDTDFAQETANLTRNQILQQAGIAMLAQANALPQSVLSLLK